MLTTTWLPKAPERVARLPTDRRGFPVPWFVSWRDGEPDFPVVDGAKLGMAWEGEKCWVCGDRLGAWRSWVVGPMSVIEGASPEPPAHHECAVFSLCACPHLSSPTAAHSERYRHLPGHLAQANISKIRSGAAALWITKGRGATPFRAGDGVLFKLNEPSRLEWYSGGRRATSAEVREAVAVGLPTLQTTAEKEGRQAAFRTRLTWLERWMPAA